MKVLDLKVTTQSLQIHMTIEFTLLQEKKEKQPTKSHICHVIESEDDAEAMNSSFSSDNNSPAEFSSVKGGELATIKRTLSELVLKVIN